MWLFTGQKGNQFKWSAFKLVRGFNPSDEYICVNLEASSNLYRFPQDRKSRNKSYTFVTFTSTWPQKPPIKFILIGLFFVAVELAMADGWWGETRLRVECSCSPGHESIIGHQVSGCLRYLDRFLGEVNTPTMPRWCDVMCLPSRPISSENHLKITCPSWASLLTCPL